MKTAHVGIKTAFEKEFVVYWQTVPSPGEENRYGWILAENPQMDNPVRQSAAIHDLETAIEYAEGHAVKWIEDRINEYRPIYLRERIAQVIEGYANCDDTITSVDCLSMADQILKLIDQVCEANNE